MVVVNVAPRCSHLPIPRRLKNSFLLCSPLNPARPDLLQTTTARHDLFASPQLHQVIEALVRAAALLSKCPGQGYDVGMVRAVVERVPCAHACIAFLPELLAQPQSTSQLFATVLAAELAAKYPLESTRQATCGGRMFGERCCVVICVV